MYRSSPSACVACGDKVETSEADLCESGLICWRCAARDDLVRLHDFMRTRVPKWQQVVGRGSLSAFCLGSLGTVLYFIGTGSPVIAIGDAVLVAVTVHRLVRREGAWGRGLAALQGWLLAVMVGAGGGPIFAIGALAALVGLNVARRAFPLYPGDAPRLLEAVHEQPLLESPK